MALKTIEQEWLGYAEMIFRGMKPKPGPGIAQYEETRKAFYAGAFMMTTAVEEIAAPHVSEQAGYEWLEDRKAEALEFYNQLTREYGEKN